MNQSISARIGDRYHDRVPSFDSSDTAYIGADGQIDLLSLDDDTLQHDIYSSSPTKSTRSTLSTRLLSGAQPAAAAALTRSKSILHSRAKSLAAWTSSFNNTITPIAEKPANRLFGDIFSGESAPVRLGVSANSSYREEEDTEFVMEYRPTLTTRPSISSRRKSATPTTTTSTKSSWFSRKSTASSQVQPAANDELLTLNINNALFPNGPADPCSPSDFNELLLNATKLLERMQTAYRGKVEYIASIQPEIEAQREEVEEAETRAQHLKMQLEDMGRKAQEHESAMRQLATQLAAEKLRVQDVDEASKAVRSIDDDDTPRRRKRGSAGSASDSGFESDWDRDTESVVSSGLPTPRTPPAVMTGSPFDNLDQRLHDRHMKLQRQAPLRAINLGYGRNGDDSAVAWNTVQQLRGENHDLRRQMGLMQQTLQGCIDFVDNVHV